MIKGNHKEFLNSLKIHKLFTIEMLSIRIIPVERAKTFPDQNAKRSIFAILLSVCADFCAYEC